LGGKYPNLRPSGSLFLYSSTDEVTFPIGIDFLRYIVFLDIEIVTFEQLQNCVGEKRVGVKFSMGLGFVLLLSKH
jgi:hypothetical protein